jgi:hypothetical protein
VLETLANRLGEDLGDLVGGVGWPAVLASFSRAAIAIVNEDD